MRFSVISVLVILLILSCHKTKITTPPPESDPQATLVFTSPDSISYSNSQPIEVKGKLSGTLSDYSFMRYVVIEGTSKDTLASGPVPKNGEIDATWINTFPSGSKYYVQMMVINNKIADDIIPTKDFRYIFICIQPQVVVTNLSTDENSITITWSKAQTNNFKAYEVFVTRTDTARQLPPIPPGKKLIRITDVNQTSFKDTSAHFFYKYTYNVNVVSQDDCENVSEGKDIEAGVFIHLPSGTPPSFGKSIFDKVRNKIYYRGKDDQNHNNLYVINPETLQIEQTISIAENASLVGMDDTGSFLNIVSVDPGPTHYKLFALDLTTFSLQEKAQFTLPFAAQIGAVSFNHIVYSGVNQGEYVLAYHQLQDNTDSLMTNNSVSAMATTNNNSTLFVSSLTNSVYVYHLSATAPQFVKAITLPGNPLSGNPSEFVFSSTNINVIGNTLFNSNFDAVYTLPNGQTFIGLSSDATYAATSDNSIIQVSNQNVVKKYGDGFGGLVYFSSDKKTLYHITFGALTTQWDPPPRLFRHNWQ